MDALFQRLADTSRKTVERVHGAAVSIYPVERYAGPNSRKEVSPFTVYEAVACFFENTLAENDAMSQPLTGNGRMMHAAPAITASIQIPGDQPFAAGVFIRRHKDGAAFEVASFKPDGLGAVLAVLNRIAKIPGDVSC